MKKKIEIKHSIVQNYRKNLKGKTFNFEKIRSEMTYILQRFHSSY